MQDVLWICKKAVNLSCDGNSRSHIAHILQFMKKQIEFINILISHTDWRQEENKINEMSLLSRRSCFLNENRFAAVVHWGSACVRQ